MGGKKEWKIKIIKIQETIRIQEQIVQEIQEIVQEMKKIVILELTEKLVSLD